MTDELHADAMKRKAKTEDLICQTYDKIFEVGFINPNDYPVYLSLHHVTLLKEIRREAAAILAKHEEAEKELRAEAEESL